MTNWTASRKNIEEFHYLAYGHLCRDGIINPTGDKKLDPWNYEPYMRLYSDMRERGFNPEELKNQKVAALMLADMVNSHYGEPQTTSAEVTVTAEATVDYGVVSLKFGLSREFACKNASQRAQAFRVLLDEVMEMHDRTTSNMPAVAQSARGAPTGDSTVVIETTHLSKSNYKGADRIRLKGGEWSKFGVPVYEEMYGPLGINPNDYDYGDHDFIRKVGVLVGASGKPEKVVMSDV